MKKIIDVLFDENKSFNFPWYVYAIVAPIVFVILIGVAGWIDTRV